MDSEHRCTITPDDFHSIISISIDGFLLVDLDGNILETNDSYCQMVGYSRDELLKLQIPAIEAVDNRDDVARRFESIIQNGSLRFETRHLHKGGAIIDVEVSANYSASYGGSVFSFIRDISSQKHLREVMAARLHLIEFSLTHSLSELLQQALDEAEALTGSCIGFYHFKDPDSQMLTLQAWSTKTTTMFCKAEGAGSHYPVSQAGVWVDCVLERRPIIHNDYASLPHKKGLPDSHATVIRELVVPIFRQDKIVAIMGVGNKAKDYTQQDVEVVSTLADLAWDVAERKKTEESLLESESRFKGAFEHSAIGMALVSPAGKWLKVNARVTEMLGYTEEELLTKTFHDITHPDDLEADLDYVRQVLAGEIATYTMEKRYFHKQGLIVWALLSVSLVRDSNGSPLHFISQIENITQRKLSDILLQKSEAILRSSQILAKVGGWEWDTALQSMTWTEETYHIHDIEPSSVTPCSAELIEKSLNCYNPEDRQRIEDAFKRCIKQGESYDLEFPFTSTTGRKLWIRTTAHAEWHDDRVVKAVGNIMDITEQKNLEYELARQADFNNRVFNSLDANMAVIDRNGVILSVNDAWSNFARKNLCKDESRWGIGANYFVKYDHKWGDAERAQEAFEGVRKVQSGQLTHFSLEYPCHGPNKERWFQLNVLPLLGDCGSVLLSHSNITVRKLAEEGLKEAEWKFRALFENGPVGVAYHSMIYDDTGKAVDYFFIDANENYITLTGVDPRGKTVTQAFPGIEKDPFDWIGIFGNVARTGETIHFEQYLQLNDRWYDVVAYQYKPDHFVASFVEITMRKRAEESLQSKQIMLARTEKISHIGSWEWDVATGTVTWSDEMFRIVQLNPDDGSPSFEDQSGIYHPDDMKELMRVVGIAVSDGTPYEIELRAIRPNGDVRICLAQGFTERGPTGKIMRLYGSLQDITERKQIEAALRILESRQAKMIENISDVIVIIDQDGINRYNSPNVEKWFGWKPDELVGINAFDNIHPDDLAAGLEFVGKLKNTPNATGTTECRYRCKDGSYKWVEVTLINLIDDPDIKGILGDYHDISERKRYEEEKQLLEQQFQQAQKLESLGVLAGGIAHDFNNILAIIIGHCSMAEIHPDRAGEHIPPIEKAADRAAGLCRQMLAYAGKATFTMTKVNMAALVDEMVQMLKATISQNIVIKPDISTDISDIKGDASQLRQIAMNLIINASEAIGEAQGVIHISLAKTAITATQSITDHLGKAIPPGWYACLEVSDTGCGMDEETRRRIFEPFYTTKFTGRGLGMSAVLGIIKAHNGALQLVSHPGKGTAFTIYLPIEASELIGDISNEQIASAQWQGSGTVLLVEDELQIQLVAKAMLENMGFIVIEAINGQEALELYRKNAADISLVITDIGMPVMNGYALFRELKLLRRDLPIIISSGFGDTVVTTRIPSEEIAGLVNKPYRYDKLLDVVKKVVE